MDSCPNYLNWPLSMWNSSSSFLSLSWLTKPFTLLLRRPGIRCRKLFSTTFICTSVLYHLQYFFLLSLCISEDAAWNHLSVFHSHLLSQNKTPKCLNCSSSWGIPPRADTENHGLGLEILILIPPTSHLAANYASANWRSLLALKWECLIQFEDEMLIWSCNFQDVIKIAKIQQLMLHYVVVTII